MAFFTLARRASLSASVSRVTVSPRLISSREITRRESRALACSSIGRHAQVACLAKCTSRSRIICTRSSQPASRKAQDKAAAAAKGALAVTKRRKDIANPPKLSSTSFHQIKPLSMGIVAGQKGCSCSDPTVALDLSAPVLRRKCDRPKVWRGLIEFKGHRGMATERCFHAHHAATLLHFTSDVDQQDWLTRFDFHVQFQEPPMCVHHGGLRFFFLRFAIASHYAHDNGNLQHDALAATPVRWIGTIHAHVYPRVC